MAKCRAVMVLKDSTDEMVKGAGVTTSSRRKWAADSKVKQAEGMLKLEVVIGNQCLGWQGLGTTHFQQSMKADPRQRRDMFQAEVRQQEKEGKFSRAGRSQPTKLQNHLARTLEVGTCLDPFLAPFSA